LEIKETGTPPTKKQQWQQYKDIAKAFGWIWERFEEYEYDE